MTGTRACEAAPVTRTQARPRAALPALCATQITSWGIVYYAFPVLNPSITRATGWSATATTGAFSAALLVSALAGIPVGRILDRRGPRAVMTTGSVLGVLSMLAIAWAPDQVLFTGGWLLAGLAMATTFYQPAFAALTRWWGEDRVKALTIVTLAGGLASTVFAPVTAALAEHVSWRVAYTLLAAVLALVTVPAHALALRAPWPPAPPRPLPSEGGAHGGTSVVRTRPFLLLAMALTLCAVTTYAGVITLVPLLMSRGATTTSAAWALGLGGAGQTLGRTLYATMARRTGPTARTAVLIATGGAVTGALALVTGPLPLLTGLAITAGMVRGNLTLLQATAVTDRWGTADYGRLSALLGAPVTVAAALAPFSATAVGRALGGYPPLFVLLAGSSVLAALVALASRPHPDGR